MPSLLVLGIGITGSLSLPTTAGNGFHSGLGVTGDASLELGTFAFGVRSRAQFTRCAHLRIETDSFGVSGSSSRREAGLAAFARYFPSAVYFEVAYLGLQTEILKEAIAGPPVESPNYRLYAEGRGFALGVGLRPPESPIFIQLNYAWQSYDRLQIIEFPKVLSQVTAEGDIKRGYLVHTLLFTFGTRIHL
jgi:hypothetical protein